ncbi:MAG: hypothetical protein PHF11_06865, partial [Candidatus Omnitrophica bacterium]|nr:hypothetical protein [Candidatus Omnitrophota bacterium]
NTGQKRYVIEVRAERVQFLGAPAAKPIEPQQQAAVSSEEPSTETAWLEESEEGVNESQG